MVETNRDRLNRLQDKFKEWLHLENDTLLYTLTAAKLTHKLPGDPVWLMLIGASSGGKSEMLRALKQPGEINIDDLTEKTFVSGYKSKATDGEPQFATKLANHIWYIFDLSVLMSKNSDERSSILSDMRQIYDGRIIKQFGTKSTETVECPNNTLICATTPVIDATILEDQQLGTRFITYRIKASNRHAMMDMIDRNQDRLTIMRDALNLSVQEFEESIEVTKYQMCEVDNQNLQIMCNMTTLLRTSVSMDRHGEPSNLSYPEEPGRLYKQMKKMYCAYRIIGLTEDESLKCIRKICQDNINPIRVRLLKHMYDNNKTDEYGHNRVYTTSQIHVATGFGKKAIKSHLHALNMLGMVSYDIEEDQFGRVIKDKWCLLEANLSLLLANGLKEKMGRSMWPIYAQCIKRRISSESVELPVTTTTPPIV